MSVIDLQSNQRRMPRIATDTEGLPRHAWLIALVFGVASAFGFQPLALWPVALLAVGGFAWLASGSPNWKRAAWLGWLFGMGHFTFGNSWIATAFTYQSNMPAILGWFAVPLLSVYLAVYPALAAAGARLLARRGFGWPFVLAFSGVWIVAEWLRGWVFTGYAWNPLGVMLVGPFDRPGLAALAPITGTYALSGLAVLLSGGVMLLLLRRRYAATGAVAVLLAAGMYWPAGEGAQGDLPVTIVQPNIRQDRLSDPRYYEENFQRLAQQSQHPDPGARRLVLWPESGMVDYLREGYPQRYYDRTTAFGSPLYARARIGRIIGEGSKLMTGAVDLEVGADETGYVRALGAYNAVTALDDGGEILGGYAKAHLVPYGEYLPLRNLLEPAGLSRLVPGTLDFLPGPGPRTLDLREHGRGGIQICYEIVFSGEVVEPGNRPDYIFNPSNDGWFGSFGPPQHFAQARLRAIEEGLPVLRATTTGISGIIDARGVVRAYLPLNERGRIEGHVPPPFEPTIFARAGNILPLGWALFLLAAALVASRRRGG